jgi:dihydropteroate synthase
MSPEARPVALPPTRIGPRTFAWGERTFVMGVLNVTPDSFSGDGLLVAGDPVATALEGARRMAADGADLLDVGGASSRPGHAPVPPDVEADRVVPVIRAIAAALPDVPISVDTTSAEVAEAALDAGAHLLNDVWGVASDPAMIALAAARGVPLVVMHNRAEPRYDDVVGEVVADLLIVDPGFGFGKTPDHNLAVLAGLATLRTALGRPVLLGTSRKSTLGRLLDLPVDQRVEATLATTALGIASGADVVRVHDVRENVRVAQTADAVVRGWRPVGWMEEA